MSESGDEPEGRQLPMGERRDDADPDADDRGEHRGDDRGGEPEPILVVCLASCAALSDLLAGQDRPTRLGFRR